MQVQVTAKSMQKRALSMLKSAKKHHHKDPRLDFLELALHGGQMGFDAILKMVDELMSVLKREQGSDDTKKAYCEAEFDKYEDISKGLTLDASDLAKAISDAKETVQTGTKEIADLTQGVKDLDKSVGEATVTRKDENANFVKTLADNSAAKELLGMAKDRLNKFYNKAAFTQEEQSGNSAESFVQTEAQRHHHRHQQVEADMSTKPKGEEANGVITMINTLIAEVTHDNTVLELEEKEAQAEYETFMGDAKSKRSLDAKAITDKEGTKAGAEATLEENKLAKKEKTTELMETSKYIMGLHQECDWLLKFHSTRKEARTDEIESLDKAKSVLNGADYSFLQTASVHLRGSK